MQEVHVIAGPNSIYSIHKQKGFEIPSGKFAIAKVDRVVDTTGFVAVYSALFDSRETAEKLARSTSVVTAKEEKEIDTVFDFDPKKDMTKIGNVHVFSQTVDHLFPPTSEIVETIKNKKPKISNFNKPRIIMFNCENCSFHKSFSTRVNKNFKIKEPCVICGKVIKAELVI